MTTTFYRLHRALPIVFGAVLLGSSIFAQEDVDGVAAVVDGEVITFLQVRRELDRFRKGAPEEYARIERDEGRLGLYRYAANVLVENELLFAEVADREISLPREYIDERIQVIIDSEAGGDWAGFRQMLIDSGQDMAEFRREVEKRLAAEALVDELVRRNVSVTPREVRDYYDRNRELFVRPERVRLGLIFLKREQGESDDALSARGEALRQRLVGGDDFGELAKEFSADSSSENGGDLGWQNVSDLNSKFRRAIQGLEAGDLASLLRDENGLLILKLSEHEKAADLGFTQPVQERIEAVLRQERERVEYKKLIAELKGRFYVKDFIAEGTPGGE